MARAGRGTHGAVGRLRCRAVQPGTRSRKEGDGSRRYFGPSFVFPKRGSPIRPRGHPRSVSSRSPLSANQGSGGRGHEVAHSLWTPQEDHARVAPFFYFSGAGHPVGPPDPGRRPRDPSGGSPRPLRRRIATPPLASDCAAAARCRSVPRYAAICRALGVSLRRCSAPVRSFNPRVRGSSPRRPTRDSR